MNDIEIKKIKISYKQNRRMFFLVCVSFCIAFSGLISCSNPKSNDASGKETETISVNSEKNDSDEISMLTSPALMVQVVERLKLNDSRSSQEVAENMLKKLSVSRIDKTASVFRISYFDSNLELAGHVVDTLIAVYNETIQDDKSQVNDYLDEQILVVKDSLDKLNARIASTKKVPANLMQEDQKSADEVSRLETELTLVNFIKRYISDPANKEQLIPTNVANDAGISAMITSYNNHVNAYNRLKVTAGENNPDLQRIKRQMEDEMKAIRTSIDNLQKNTTERLKTARNQVGRAQEKNYATPTQAKDVNELVRQQKIQEELYLYLLGKREESKLTSISTNGLRIIESKVEKDYVEVIVVSKLNAEHK